MSTYASIHLFFKRKYTYKGIHPLFENLHFKDFSLSPIQKSSVYNEIDLRLYEGWLNFKFEDKNLIFNVLVEEYEGDEGTNHIELQCKSTNRDTYEAVWFSDGFLSILKNLKHLEGIALVGEDETAPRRHFYAAFKNGDFDVYLHPSTGAFSADFYLDAYKRHLQKHISMNEEQIRKFIQELKEKNV
jgi:hypothetical protein